MQQHNNSSPVLQSKMTDFAYGVWLVWRKQYLACLTAVLMDTNTDAFFPVDANYPFKIVARLCAETSEIFQFFVHAAQAVKNF